MNTIDELVDRTYLTVSVLEDVHGITERLKSAGYVVVLNETSTIAGVLTLKDFFRQTGNRLTDFNFEKPVVRIGDSVEAVAKIMLRSGHWELPVFDGAEFTGIITLERIVKRALKRELY